MSTDTLNRSKVRIEETRNAVLTGLLTVPHSAQGIVVCLRDGDAQPWPSWDALEQRVVDALHAQGLASLCLEHVTDDSQGRNAPSKRVEAMASRLAAVTTWLLQDPDTHSLGIGYLAPGETAAAAALAASRAPDYIAAIVAVRGRIELAEDAWSKVHAPTLLAELHAPGGTSLPPALAGTKRERSVEMLSEAGFESELAPIACRWFVRHLSSGFHSTPAG